MSSQDDQTFLDSLLDAVSRPVFPDESRIDIDADDDNIDFGLGPDADADADSNPFAPARTRARKYNPAVFTASSSASAAAVAAAADLRSLTRFFVAEKAVSTLLPWPAALLGRVLGRIERQIAKIEDLQAALEDDSVAAAAANSRSRPGQRRAGPASRDALQTARFALIALETDLERHKFLVRALLRTRLAKISHYGRTWLRHDDELAEQHGADPEADDDFGDFSKPAAGPGAVAPPGTLMSPEERSFARAHTALFEKHIMESCLSRFPASMRRFDDNAAGMDMLQGPDEAECVIVRVLEGDGDKDGSEEEDDDDDIMMNEDGDDDDPFNPSPKRKKSRNWKKGDVWVLLWKQVKQDWERGRIELL